MTNRLESNPRDDLFRAIPADEDAFVASRPSAEPPDRPSPAGVIGWAMPDPFEPRYAYPLLVWLVDSRDRTTLFPIDRWLEGVGSQNMATAVVDLAAFCDDVADAADVSLALSAARLMQPSSLVVNEDRVFVAGHRAAGDLAVRAWLDRSRGLAGAAAIRPLSSPHPAVGPTGRVAGRLLVASGQGWRQSGLALFAAGAEVELHARLREPEPTGRAIERWVLASIPTAVGIG